MIIFLRVSPPDSVESKVENSVFSGCFWQYRITICWHHHSLSPASRSEALLSKHSGRLDQWEGKKNQNHSNSELVTLLRTVNKNKTWSLFILHRFSQYYRMPIINSGFVHAYYQLLIWHLLIISKQASNKSVNKMKNWILQGTSSGSELTLQFVVFNLAILTVKIILNY